jgi:hypothetical protein
MDDLVKDSGFRARLARYSLSELEDVLTHVDRDSFPDRVQIVTHEIESRLVSVDVAALEAQVSSAEAPPSFFKRLGASLVDVSIQVMIPYIVLYFVVKVIYTPLGNNKIVQYLFPPEAPSRPGGGPPGGGRGGAGRRGAAQSNEIWSDITGWWDALQGFVSGVISEQPEALSTLWVVGKYFAIYFVFRMMWTCWRLSKSGATSGMKEMGLVLCRRGGGALSVPRIVCRFVLHYVLLVVTLGISGLWMFWDKEKCGLHDRLMGTRMVQVFRSWEKPDKDRMFD